MIKTFNYFLNDLEPNSFEDQIEIEPALKRLVESLQNVKNSEMTGLQKLAEAQACIAAIDEQFDNGLSPFQNLTGIETSQAFAAGAMRSAQALVTNTIYPDFS